MDSIRFSGFKPPQALSKSSASPTQPLRGRSPLSTIDRDTVQFGSNANDTNNDSVAGRPLQASNPEDRAALIRVYSGTFANQDTRDLLTQYLEEHPAISTQPELFLEALQQLAQHEHNLRPEQAIERYDAQLLHASENNEQSAQPLDQPFLSRRERARQRRNTPQFTDLLNGNRNTDSADKPNR